jgi:hypothetical protein
MTNGLSMETLPSKKIVLNKKISDAIVKIFE